MATKKPIRTEDDTETALLLEISDLQQRLVKAQEALHWIVYESLLTVNAAFPLVAYATKDKDDLAMINKAEVDLDNPLTRTELAITTNMCFRDSTAASIWAALEVLGAGELDGNALSAQKSADISRKLYRLFKEKYTHETGGLKGAAEHLGRSSVYGHSHGDSIEVGTGHSVPSTGLDGHSVPSTGGFEPSTKLSENTGEHSTGMDTLEKIIRGFNK